MTIDDRDHGHGTDLADTAVAYMPEHLSEHQVATMPRASASLVQRFAARYAVDPDKLLVTLKATCFKTEKPASNEQMMSLLIVAEQYRLNPFTRELFAFADKSGGIIPYVSVDGWSRIINERPEFNGVSFLLTSDPQAITCTIHRKDRAYPTVVTEYMHECKRSSIPWQTTPLRMLRHRALIQCARLAFGFAGIYDEDEARRIRDMGIAERADVSGLPEVVESEPIAKAKAAIRERAAMREGPKLTYAEIADQLKKCRNVGSANAVLALGAHLPEEQQGELRELAATLDLDPEPKSQGGGDGNA